LRSTTQGSADLAGAPGRPTWTTPLPTVALPRSGSWRPRTRPPSCRAGRSSFVSTGNCCASPPSRSRLDQPARSLRHVVGTRRWCGARSGSWTSAHAVVHRVAVSGSVPARCACAADSSCWSVRSRHRYAIGSARCAPFASGWAEPGVDGPDHRPADVRVHEAAYPHPLGLRGGAVHVGVPAHPATEPDRAIPRGRVGEHQVRPGGPLRELPELWRPHHQPVRCPDRAPIGVMRGMRHTMGFYS
jgi:hypothetical protein